LADFNKALGTDLKSFLGIECKNATTFIISNGARFYEYNTTTKTGKLTAEFSDSDENQTFDNAKENIAFTVKNNLFYLNKNNEKIANILSEIADTWEVITGKPLI
jgi:dipeptidyl-peptidase-4